MGHLREEEVLKRGDGEDGKRNVTKSYISNARHTLYRRTHLEQLTKECGSERGDSGQIGSERSRQWMEPKRILPPWSGSMIGRKSRNKGNNRAAKHS